MARAVGASWVQEFLGQAEITRLFGSQQGPGADRIALFVLALGAIAGTIQSIMGFKGTGAVIAMGLAAALAGSVAGQIVPFTNEASARGLTYLMGPGVSGGVGYGRSVGFADLDGDLDMDVICLGRANDDVGIYENIGGGYFVSRTATSGIPAQPMACSFAAGDYDGDGDLDLIITTWGNGIRLMRNEGGFTFVDKTASAGLSEFAATTGVSWGDLDGDGWIDLFVCNYLSAIPNTANAKNRLWRNNGNGTFTDVAPSLGLDDSSYSFIAALFDADLDGDLDIYLSNDRAMYAPFKPNRFLRNDGNWVFTDIGAQNGSNLTLFSMGVACGDLDGNGLPDLYCTNIASPVPPLNGQNPLLLQQPGGNFVMSQVAWGVEANKTSWGCTFFDVDNDADMDLYVVNQFEANALYVRTGPPPMVNIGVSAGVAGPSGTTTMDYCASVADVDGDGDLDILVNNLSSTVRLFINHEGELRKWSRFRVVGEGKDTHGLGTTVRVRTGATWQMRQLINGANGYLSQNDGLLHFGLGSAATMDEVEVRWPNTGTTRTLTNYPSSHRWRLFPPQRLGDVNGNGVVNQADLSAFSLALAGAFVPGKEIFDMDGDGALTSADAALFHLRFTGLRGDFNGNGVVAGDDLGVLLQHWGAARTAYDLNLDGKVDGADLGILLASWGS